MIFFLAVTASKCTFENSSHARFIQFAAVCSGKLKFMVLTIWWICTLLTLLYSGQTIGYRLDAVWLVVKTWISCEGVFLYEISWESLPLHQPLCCEIASFLGHRLIEWVRCVHVKRPLDCAWSCGCFSFLSHTKDIAIVRWWKCTTTVIG